MSLESRLNRLEVRAGANDPPRCTHVITITSEGEPVPPSRCECDGVHINIEVCRPEGTPDEFRVTT
jgi:hypothetical protein